MFSLSYSKVRYDISSTTIANGQSILVQMYPDKEDISKAYVAFEGKQYPMYENELTQQKDYYTWLSINYYTKPKDSKIVIVTVINNKKEYKSFPISIVKGKYKSEKLRVSSSKAKFNPINQARIKKEAKEAMKIYNTYTPESYIIDEYKYPLSSKITSPFGTRRVFNGTLKSYHSGTDFRAPLGTPIKAANDGVVVLAKERFLSGNSVIIDHGHGIYSQYYHFSKLKVKKGDFVSKGEVLGMSGSTGRSTGPHLHLGFRVNANQVDPLQFIESANSLFRP